MARRESTLDPWSVPENLGPIVNSTDFEQRPAISWDALTLIFTSNRVDGNFGNFDLYETIRTKRRGHKDGNGDTEVVTGVGAEAATIIES